MNKLRFNTMYVFFFIVSECLDLNRINLFKICILLLLLLFIFLQCSTSTKYIVKTSVRHICCRISFLPTWSHKNTYLWATPFYVPYCTFSIINLSQHLNLLRCICSYWYIFRVLLKSAPRYVNAMRPGSFLLVHLFSCLMWHLNG